MKRLVLAFAILLSCVVAFADDPPKRPRIFGIAKIEFYSSDLRAANKFYTPVLAMMQPTNCAGGCENLPPPHGFSPNGLQVIGLDPRPKPADANRIEEITFATENLAALRRYLEFHKIPVTVVDRPDAAIPGRMPLTITDPEGHRISFLEWTNYQAEQSTRDPRLQEVIHVGFVVHDRDAEDRFYKDLLGFHVYWHGGMKDNVDDWVDMQVPDGTNWIEYMLNVSSNADKHTLGVMNHVAIGVPDIHAAYEGIMARGFTPAEKPKIGRDGKWQLNLYDPDDTRVEFMEFTPTNKPCCSPYLGPHPRSQVETQTKPAAQPNP
jgi:catechol 2,3-dioxygenase-like lactoylglutathione lyase family enzyme